ncbi:MAG: hypothetical protein ACLGG7_13330 [Bacteriovoracia bacterium]
MRYWYFVAVVLLGLFLIAPASAAVVTVEASVKDVPEEDVRQKLFQLAVEKLVLESLAPMNLDRPSYEAAVKKKFEQWLAELEKRGAAPEQLVLAKARGVYGFANWEKLLRRYTIKNFTAHPEVLAQWSMTLDAEVDEKFLALHVQRMQQQAREFRRLYLSSQIHLENFTWEDLKLTQAGDFMTPVEAEWLKWFQDNPPEDVDEVVLCDADCQVKLERWRAHDEKAMGTFFEPDFVGGLLLTSTIQLQRELISGVSAETRMTYTGGVILQDLNTKRVLHWADLPREVITLRTQDQKKLNSGLATQTFRYPLSKFTETKNQVSKSVTLTNAVVVKLQNPRHLGDVMRLIDWLRTKGAPMQAQGKLDSFNSSTAKILVHFRGEGNKFKALVSGVTELESEWGRTLTIEDQGSDIVITLKPKP